MDPNLHLSDTILWAVLVPLVLVCSFIIVQIYYGRKEGKPKYPKAFKVHKSKKVTEKELDRLLDFHEKMIS